MQLNHQFLLCCKIRNHISYVLTFLLLYNFHYLYQNKFTHKKINPAIINIKNSFFYRTISYINFKNKIAKQTNTTPLNLYITDKNNSILKTKNNGKNGIDYQYNAYGKIITQPDILKKNNVVDFKYNGEAFDKHTNLLYLKSRYYKVNLMRFINQDSYNLLNKFNYTNSNPINNIDPNGHLSITAINTIIGLTTLGGVASIIFSGGATAPVISGILSSIGGVITFVGNNVDKNNQTWQDVAITLAMIQSVLDTGPLAMRTATVQQISHESQILNVTNEQIANNTHFVIDAKTLAIKDNAQMTLNPMQYPQTNISSASHEMISVPTPAPTPTENTITTQMKYTKTVNMLQTAISNGSNITIAVADDAEKLKLGPIITHLFGSLDNITFIEKGYLPIYSTGRIARSLAIQNKSVVVVSPYLHERFSTPQYSVIPEK